MFTPSRLQVWKFCYHFLSDLVSQGTNHKFVTFRNLVLKAGKKEKFIAAKEKRSLLPSYNVDKGSYDHGLCIGQMNTKLDTNHGKVRGRLHRICSMELFQIRSSISSLQ